jgi:spore coat polysaccharide biosynthesis protein SpsF (cytidylyltransferase family)
MSKIGVVIQARTGSTRLPNKMLKTFYENDLLIDTILTVCCVTGEVKMMY